MARKTDRENGRVREEERGGRVIKRIAEKQNVIKLKTHTRD
jgi:hypothetical protein